MQIEPGRFFIEGMHEEGTDAGDFRGGQYSIQALFAELALGRDDVTDHNDIFLKSQQNLIGPDQTRIPMVPFREGE